MVSLEVCWQGLVVSLEVCWRIRSSTSSIKILDDKTEGELVFKKGSDFPTWPIIATTGEHGGKNH